MDKYLQDYIYRIIPVKPAYEKVLGEKCYTTLLDVPEKVGTRYTEAIERNYFAGHPL